MAILNEQGEGQPSNLEANKTAFQFGWFHTRDIDFFDSDGYMHLVGHIKELINRGGEKTSPIEVDAFGVFDEKYVEQIKCVVILKEVSLVDAKITRYCKKNLVGFKESCSKAARWLLKEAKQVKKPRNSKRKRLHSNQNAIEGYEFGYIFDWTIIKHLKAQRSRMHLQLFVSILLLLL